MLKIKHFLMNNWSFFPTGTFFQKKFLITQPEAEAGTRQRQVKVCDVSHSTVPNTSATAVRALFIAIITAYNRKSSTYFQKRQNFLHAGFFFAVHICAHIFMNLRVLHI